MQTPYQIRRAMLEGLAELMKNPKVSGKVKIAAVEKYQQLTKRSRQSKPRKQTADQALGL